MGLWVECLLYKCENLRLHSQTLEDLMWQGVCDRDALVPGSKAERETF